MYSGYAVGLKPEQPPKKSHNVEPMPVGSTPETGKAVRYFRVEADIEMFINDGHWEVLAGDVIVVGERKSLIIPREWNPVTRKVE